MDASPNLKNKLTFVVLGRSGCGKGTQAKFLLKRLETHGVYYIQTGELLRKILSEKENPTTTRGKRIMREGGLFPEFFPIFLWLRELIENGNADKHIVYDGGPRRILEAKMFDDTIEWHGRPLPLCVYIDISAKSATRRLLARGRADDTTPVIKGRMNYFPKYVLPVIRYYQKRGRCVRINGEQETEKVWQEIDGALKKKLGKKWSRSRDV